MVLQYTYIHVTSPWKIGTNLGFLTLTACISQKLYIVYEISLISIIDSIKDLITRFYKVEILTQSWTMP